MMMSSLYLFVCLFVVFFKCLSQGLFNHLVSLTEEARKAYKDMVSALEQEQAEEALKNDKKVPHHMGHSRNHSAASAISFCSIFSEPISEVNEKEYGKPCFCFFTICFMLSVLSKNLFGSSSWLE